MLLADLHVHTTWSDGRLPMRDVIDLFGRSGHDVIAITDHVVNRDGVIGRSADRLELSLNETNFDLYLEELRSEAGRAMTEYDMLVLPGIELTHNTISFKRSAHVLALGIDHFISADGAVLDMLKRAQSESSVVIACHPHEQSDWFANTYYLWNNRSEVADYIHLWEAACRWDLFPPVSRARLPFIGNSDFHDTPHLYAWKSLLDCRKDADEILQSLAAGKVAAITRLSKPEANALQTQVSSGGRHVW